MRRSTGPAGDWEAGPRPGLRWAAAAHLPGRVWVCGMGLETAGAWAHGGAERGGATIPHLARGGVQTWTGRGLMGTGWGLGQAGTLTQPWHPAGPSGCVPPCGQPHLPSGSLRPRPQRASSIRACGPCPWWVPEYRRTATSGLQRQAHLSPLGSSLAPNREAYPHLQQRWAGRSSKEVGSMGRPGFKSPLHQVLLSNPQLHPHNTPSSVSTGLIYKM